MRNPMPRLRLTLAALLLSGFAVAAGAHPGHGDPISQEQAVQRATAQIDRLVSSGKIEKSWKMAATLKTAALREKGEDREWALTFVNPQASQEQQRTLYVFLSETGEYLAANFTGR